MGQKTNPISNRIGIIRGWDSNWYGGTDYASKILEDARIREYLLARLAKASLSKIVIERTLKLITVTIHTARPGLIIGKGGQEVDKLKEELKKISNKEVQINIFEIKRPELDATIVANNIARQVEGRVSYRRAIKMAMASTVRMGAEGIKVLISGRLAGAEMARSEMLKEGRTPLHTFRADIDYALAEAHTKVGVLGIKVWICNGEVYGKRDLSPNVGTSAASSVGAPMGGGERRDRGDRRRGDRRRGSGGGDRRGGGGDRRGGSGGGDYRGSAGGGDRRGGTGGGDYRGGSGGGDHRGGTGGGDYRGGSGGGDRRGSVGGGDHRGGSVGGGDRRGSVGGGDHRGGSAGGGDRRSGTGGGDYRGGSAGGGDRRGGTGGGDYRGGSAGGGDRRGGSGGSGGGGGDRRGGGGGGGDRRGSGGGGGFRPAR